MTEMRHITHIAFSDPNLVARNVDMEHERQIAIADILQKNHFILKNGEAAPYRLFLSADGRHLIITIRRIDDTEIAHLHVALSIFRRLIKDYLFICESYYDAMRQTPEQIETIDASRRALHNEGADLLRQKLADTVDMDDDTARRLFTLISILHMRG